MSAGTFHSCAMPVSGPPAVCWGNNAAGRVQPSLSPAQPPAATVGVPYNHLFVMATHLSPAPTYRLVGGTLPPGVTLTPQGQLTGTPTTPGTYQFTVAASTALVSARLPGRGHRRLHLQPWHPGLDGHGHEDVPDRRWPRREHHQHVQHQLDDQH